MEKKHRRRLRESGIPLDTWGPLHFLAIGIGPHNGEPQHIIPREDWPREIAAMEAEEAVFWKGKRDSIKLMVELPFWLTIPDCEIPLAYGGASVRASIRGQYMAVSDGPLFFDSQCNVVFVGPNEDLKVGAELPKDVAATKAPVYRPMKTVVIFRPEAMEEAVLTLLEPEMIEPHDSCAIRRINRAMSYLQSLAYAHIPFLNRLITDYRFASSDPFAFQVSQWNIPVWFVESNSKFVRLCLMPYSNNDWYPATREFEMAERTPFHATTPQAVVVQARVDVAPGTLEILDARSLLYRGHIEDAIRSAITAVEVALEGQIAKLLGREGWTEQQIQSRLAETWNDFDKRVSDYETISNTRVPGPILSCLPYINGIRLKAELSRVRKLRHKIVHEGLRVDSRSRGPMVRHIEAMMWLFYWLSWEEGEAKEESNSYVFFETMRGLHVPRYSIAYDDFGVVLCPDDHDKDYIEVEGDVIRSQYLASIEGRDSDIELFTLMSLAYLCVDAEDAPPPAVGACAHERYYFDHRKRKVIVFCLESDGSVDSSTIIAVAARFRDVQKQHEGICSALCVVNQQKNTAIDVREVDEAIPDQVNQIASESGVAMITAADLRFLVQGAMEYGWDKDHIKDLMLLRGRQGAVPPEYRRIGACAHFYSRLSVMSVRLDPDETVKVGGVLGVRLATRFHEERIESLQVDHDMVHAATGPCRVGIKTTLQRSDVDTGQAVFIRVS